MLKNFSTYVEHLKKCIQTSSRHYYKGPITWVCSLNTYDTRIFYELVEHINLEYALDSEVNNDARAAIKEVAKVLAPKLRPKLNPVTDEHLDLITNELIDLGTSYLSFAQSQIEQWE